MSEIEKAVYLADLISADRTYPGVETLRAKTYRSLDEAMMDALEYMLGSIAKKKLPLLPLTADAYNEYRFLTKDSEG